MLELDLQKIYDNYAELTPEEREYVRELMNGPARRIMAKLFGADFDAAMGNFMKPLAKEERKTGLASKQ
ncbi:MAG TPA: hypothetical protein DCM40_40735 [Maribacter sp.]|nr:hypothetical protein [Maribacter sp.]|tara:strand:- start:1019 stop:1225 length:207 start_codon:yes stop_codon:yes gene_type:complete